MQKMVIGQKSYRIRFIIPYLSEEQSAEINSVLVKNDHKVYSLAVSKQNLENLFLSITQLTKCRDFFFRYNLNSIKPEVPLLFLSAILLPLILCVLISIGFYTHADKIIQLSLPKCSGSDSQERF
jgi:hypothetical protein